MPIDFEPLKRLPPETKVVELRRLIDNLKRRVEDHQRDIRTAESLLALAEDEQKVVEQETEKADIRTAIKKETKETTPSPPQRRRQELENIVGREPPQNIEQIAQRPLSDLYREIKTIYETQQRTGIETNEQRNRAYELRGGVYQKRKDVEEGRYKPGETQKHLLSASEQLVNAISGYQNNKEQQRPYRRNE